MTDTTDRSGPPDFAGDDEQTVPAGVETTERYETEEGVVLYDATNPLAGVEAGHALWLAEQA